MSFISQWLPLASSLLVALMAIYILLLNRRVSTYQKSVSQHVSELSNELQGLSHASIGVGRKTLEIDKKIEVLNNSIEEVRNNDPATVSYSEASRLVELGASIDDLMNTCGISRPEAELVTALTQSKKSLSSDEEKPSAFSKQDERVPVLTVSV